MISLANVLLNILSLISMLQDYFMMNLPDKKGVTMQKTIYLAGGCFWGVEAYFQRIPGVLSTCCGYTNGNSRNPSYKEVCHNNTGHAETVKIDYDPERLPLKNLLRYYFRIIDPTSLNKQGNDVGTQYRTGIYYVEEADKGIIQETLKKEQEQYSSPLVVEVLPLAAFDSAEEYHQDYLNKNPGGYCHISLALADEPLIDSEQYQPLSEKELQEKLTKEEYNVLVHSATDRPFENVYWDTNAKGLYVDRATGEPLFSSKDKFHSACGWPSFAKPIAGEVIRYLEDNSLGMRRIEVRSQGGDYHLGHVFNDGPRELGGLRYCINSSSIRFIP